MKTAKEICEILNLKYYTLDYLIRNKLLPEPKRIGSGQRVFSDADLAKIKEILANRRRVAKSQRENKQGIDVGSGFHQVSPVAYWHRNRHFKNEDEARGAFALAYQQGLDGMGKSISKWMGLSDTDFNSWMKDGSLPGRKKTLNEGK